MNTIHTIVKKDLCVGCGTCIALCPNGAISLEKNFNEGIYTPNICSDKCNNCGICIKICPGQEVNFKELNMEIFSSKPKNPIIGNYVNLFAGNSRIDSLGYNCASGGIITAILLFMLKKGIIDGALVTRMNEENPFEPEPIIARTKKEIINSSKSKYCPVPANLALKEILESKESDKFAVVGLPCHIQGIRKAELINKKLKDKIVLHIGIWCSLACNFHATDFTFKRYGVDKKKVEKIEYRGHGWPGGMSIKLKGNIDPIYIPLGKYWDYNFSSFIPNRCRFCVDASAELADISCGDYRGKKISLNPYYGKSGIISRNDYGKSILNKMDNESVIKIFETDFEDISYLQTYFYSKKKDNTPIFNSILKRDVPHYDTEYINSNILDYVLKISLHFRVFMASKKYLWNLLMFYNYIFYNLIEFMSNIRS